MESGKLCIPGERLFKAGDEYAAGRGTYIVHGHIYSSLAGYLNISSSPNEKVSRVDIDPPVSAKRFIVLPTVGDVVTCKIVGTFSRYVKCMIHCVRDQALTHPFSAAIRKEDVVDIEKHKVDIFKSFHVGDVVLAKVSRSHSGRVFSTATMPLDNSSLPPKIIHSIHPPATSSSSSSFVSLPDEGRKHSCPVSSSPSSASIAAVTVSMMNSSNKVLVGVCAMAKKASGKPMRHILGRLQEYYSDYLEVLVFPETVILDDPVESWPVVHVLIGFHAVGFPMEKVQAYVKLRDPYVVNDLEKQLELLDRTKVYKALEALRIDLPRYTVMMRRDSDCSESTLIEHDDHIEVNGQIFNKPFVEKPVSAEDHNIYIYYPSSAGGGSQRLFRKVNNRSSVYSSESRVRRTGSYIYEEFMPTDGTDVKVYAVGPDYAHAEARKSPALDGKVERDSEGKEIRYPVILTNREKTFARKIVWMFRQTVCGFDLLRANGKSYVCDVNGFSFVKTSTKYYEDTARILGNMIVRKFAPRLRIPWAPPSLDDPPLVSTTYGTVMELRCVLGVIRHGDRTPKQKLKMEVYHSRWFELFNKYAIPSKTESTVQELKLKRPNQLQEVLDIARCLLNEIDQCAVEEKQSDIAESKGNLEQVKTVLEMYGHFSGINRKVQFKYLRDGRLKVSSDTETDSGSKMQSTLLLILKWGGELTPAGVMQAEELGKAFRCLYPGGQGQYGGDSRGLGFLRLHSTYRHDLKIYASEEGRVQMTAAAFTKGLLALEGELAPILVQMVKSANTDGLLDDDKEARRYQTKVKKYLHQYLQVDRTLDKEDIGKLNQLESKSIQNALQFIENPRRRCDKIWNLTSKLYDIIRMRRRDARLKDQTLYLSETWDLAERRWSKLVKDFRRVKKDGEVSYDISKIPDIYDCIKYDLEHNVKFFNTDDMEELYICSKYMADVVVPQEYGIQRQEKLLIGQGTCTPLMKKMMRDLKICVQPEEGDDGVSTRLDPRASEGIQTPARHVRTRLYFTSESHIHSLMNVIRYGGLVQDATDKQWQRAMNFLSSVTELNYMAQLVIMLYEDTTKDLTADDRFHVELHFSPGALPCIQTTHVPGLGYRPKSRENDMLTPIPSGSNSVAPLSRLASVEESKLSESASIATITSDEAAESDTVGEGSSKKVLTAPVNIVAVGDRISRPITNEELARYSPSSTPRTLSPVAGITTAQSLPETMSGKPLMMKSMSDVSCSATIAAAPAISLESEDQEQPNYNSNVVSVTEQTTNSRRSRLFYAGVRHHTTNLLRHRDNMNLKQLISTAVINGLFTNNREERMFVDPAIVNTAVIARGSSEPDLLTFNKLAQAIQQDVTDISFYVPPLRSLETLHNQLSLRQVTEFLERVTTTKTPAASPPKTPRACTHLSRENSLMSGTTSATHIGIPDGSQLSAAISERLGKLKDSDSAKESTSTDYTA